MSAEAPQLCSACSSIGIDRREFEQPPFEPEGKYNSVVLTGTVGHLRRSRETCPLCRLIAYALCMNDSLNDEADDTEWQMTWRQNNEEYDPDSDEAENFYGSALNPRLQINSSHTDHTIQLVDEPSTDAFLRGRMIPESINIELIQGWLRRCAERHGENCKWTYLQMAPHPSASREFLVIDVKMECLTNLPLNESYVALSYVWGKTANLMTVKCLLSDFRKPGAFGGVKVPKTISDAIHLTRALDFCYLWVDSLCIIQDDEQLKGLLISNMDAIYGHAALTVVAASGLDAEAGLQGYRNSPPERQPVVEIMGPGWTLGVLPFFDRAIMESPHAKRGWTYQEGCLSTRCLVILDGKAFFCCRAAIWREDVMAEVDDVVPLEGANTLGRTLSPWPLRRYMQHVGAYTMRQLTHQSDALNAFAGIGKALAMSMSATRMFYAIPAVVFDWAILWMGSLKLRSLKRRHGFPSWAWAGWEGEIMIAGDIFSSFDQKWLLERTWVEWSLVIDTGEIIVVWDPERDQTNISPLITEHPLQTSENSSRASVEMEGFKEIQIQDSVLDGENSDKEAEDDNTDESFDEDGVEACPTYGIPCPRNAYGRHVNPQLLSFLPVRPVLKTSSIVQDRRLSPGTLVFSTVVASFLMDVTCPSTSFGTAFFQLRDTSGHVCGCIWDDLEHSGAERTSPQVRELLLISDASPGTTSMSKTGEEIGLSAEYRHFKTQEEAMEALAPGSEPEGDYILNEWHNWDFFNVMLPQRVEDEQSSGSGNIFVYERVGIGILHKKALTHSFGTKPQWRTIFLR